MSHLRLEMTYEWTGLEELCLPQADKVMAALLATDDRGKMNRPKISTKVTVTSTRHAAPDRPY